MTLDVERIREIVDPTGQHTSQSFGHGDMGGDNCCWRCTGANPTETGACERCREYLASDEVRPVDPYEPPVVAVEEDDAA
jgi:hypothetical protein